LRERERAREDWQRLRDERERLREERERLREQTLIDWETRGRIARGVT
jgi:hypothetical protein